MIKIDHIKCPKDFRLESYRFLTGYELRMFYKHYIFRLTFSHSNLTDREIMRCMDISRLVLTPIDNSVNLN